MIFKITQDTVWDLLLHDQLYITTIFSKPSRIPLNNLFHPFIRQNYISDRQFNHFIFANPPDKSSIQNNLSWKPHINQVRLKVGHYPSLQSYKHRFKCKILHFQHARDIHENKTQHTTTFWGGDTNLTEYYFKSLPCETWENG